MNLRLWLPVIGLVPTVVLVAQQPPAVQTCEQVYKDIQVLKGVPASDLIPSMEFMSASLKVSCDNCHNPADFAAATRGKDEARNMIRMQRDINQKWFNSRLEVTCMSCHNGKERPSSVPNPAAVTERHEPAASNTEPKTLFEKHIAGVGTAPASITLTGTLMAPNDQTHKVETNPLELVQASDGRFRLVSGARKFGFDGQQVWYYDTVLTDEPAAVLSRLGRSWRGGNAFAGLERVSLAGQEWVGKSKALVVRANRTVGATTEELYFDTKTGLLSKLVTFKRSSLGRVVTEIVYSNYKAVSGVRVPMKVVTTFATGEVWTMNFKSTKAEATSNDSMFRKGSG